VAKASEAHEAMLSRGWLKHPACGRSCALGPGPAGAVPYGLALYGDTRRCTVGAMTFPWDTRACWHMRLSQCNFWLYYSHFSS